MSTAAALPSKLVDSLREAPIHPVLTELVTAARDSRVMSTVEFRKLVAYLLELADGRDRREPWTSKPGVVRPVPKLRVAMEACFGQYADLHWFRLNKTTNRSGQPLLGLFPRMAASVARIDLDDLAGLLTALLAPAPDAALLRWLQDRGGRVRGVGVELFSRLAYAMRRDLYFVIPREWGEASGCLRYIGEDLRRYCGLCRNLRAVCDGVGVPEDIRGAIFAHLMGLPRPPAALLEGVHKALGSSLARYSALEASAAYEPRKADADDSAMPMEFAARSVRHRRGLRPLRDKLLKLYGERCAITGACLRDLLEVAHVVPYPTGDVHALGNVMLLRSDVHTLWDLNLLGIDPATMRVRLAPALGGTDYEVLAGRAVASKRDGSRVDRAGLEERWRLFVSAHRSATGGAEKPRPRPRVKAAAPAAEPAQHKHGRRDEAGETNGSPPPTVTAPGRLADGAPREASPDETAHGAQSVS